MISDDYGEDEETLSTWSAITRNQRLRHLTIDRPAWRSAAAKELELPEIACEDLNSIVLNLPFKQRSYSRKVLQHLLHTCPAIYSLEVRGTRGLAIFNKHQSPG